MLTEKSEEDKAAVGGYRRFVIMLAWLAMAWTPPAFPADTLVTEEPAAPTTQISEDSQLVDAVTFLDSGATPVTPVSTAVPTSSLRLAPIALGFQGKLGYNIEQRSFKARNTTLHQKLALELKGLARSYIAQPWLAQVKGNLDFRAHKSLTNASGSSSNAILGGVGLALLPYSRFPFDASLARNRVYVGAGIGLLNSQTTRFNVRQSYTPRDTKEVYRLNYIRSLTDSVDLNNADLQTGLNFTMTSRRFKQQTLQLEADRQHGTNGDHLTTSSLVLAEHTYRPRGGTLLDSDAHMVKASDHTAQQSSSFKNRQINSVLTVQPGLEPYSVIGSARAQVIDRNTPTGSIQTRTANLNLGANYTLSQYINLSASGNINVTNSERTVSLSSTQAANGNYPIAAISIGDNRYNSHIGGSISNTTSLTGSTQSVSLSPSHSLARNIGGFHGGTLSLGLNQSANFSESTRSQASARLTHSSSANWRRVQGKSSTSVRLNGRDSRSMSKANNSFQIIDFNVTLKEQFTRYSSLSGALATQATRQEIRFARLNQDDAQESYNAVNSSAILQYNHARAFDISRLTFDSKVRVSSKAPLPVLAATSKDQGPITWENILTYSVGRLFADFKLNLTRDSDDSIQSLIALSLTRYF